VNEVRTYSAAQIGSLLGISAKRVGMLTNEHNLKTRKYGRWVHAWIQYEPEKYVSTFRYYENIIPVLKELLQPIETKPDIKYIQGTLF